MAIPASTITLVTKTVDSIVVEVTAPSAFLGYDRTRVTWVDIATGETGFEDIIGDGTVTLTPLRHRALHTVVAQTLTAIDEASIVGPSSIITTISQFESDALLCPQLEIDAVVVQPDGLILIEYRAIALDTSFGDLTSFRYNAGPGFIRMTPAETHPLHDGIENLSFSLAPGDTHFFVWDAEGDLGDNFVGEVDIKLIATVSGIDTAAALEPDIPIDFRAVAGLQLVVAPGETLDLEFTTFIDGVPADYDLVQVTEVLDPTGATLPGGPFGAISQPGDGNYTVPLAVASTADLGLYTAKVIGRTPATSPFTREASFDAHFFVVSAETFGSICVRDPDTTILYGQLFGPDKRAIANHQIDFRYITDTEEVTQIGLQPISLLTDAQGRFCVALLRRATISIVADDLNISRRILLPDAATASFISFSDSQPSIVARDAYGHPIVV